MLVLGFPDYDRQASALAKALNAPYRLIELHRFPDGESQLRLPPALPGQVVLCRSLDRPNGKLVELLLAAGCARQLGASQLILVAPYLCYMRQDAAFHPGEAVSQAIVQYRQKKEITGPLFVGMDTHALSEPALASQRPLGLKVTA